MHNPLPNTSPQALAQKTKFHSRGYLPHIEGAEYQMLTYRLADSLPASVSQYIKEMNPKQQREQTEEILDKGYGQCWLARPDIAEVVMENWWYFHNQRYELIACVIMPNHVHVLIRLIGDVQAFQIVRNWKSYTTKRISELLAKSKEFPSRPLWQAEYWDRYIRNQSHYENAINYIHNNPVKAGFVKNAEDWPWSSALEPHRWDRKAASPAN